MPYFLIFRACGISRRPIFSLFGLAEFPDALFFDFLALRNFPTANFLIFRAPEFPDGQLFDFLALLEFQQTHFFHFQACWSSSNPVF